MTQGLILAAVQAMCLLLLLVGTAPVDAVRPVAAVLVAAAAAAGAWALSTMGLRHLRMTPDVARGAPLLRHGPFRFVRHPMYLSVLVGVAGLLVQRFSWARAALAALLVADLALKIRIEERRLSERFPDYEAYRRRTRRIVPWVL
jgi:protein-S-isoprenylcysteine O-methyltransferase Ste14